MNSLAKNPIYHQKSKEQHEAEPACDFEITHRDARSHNVEGLIRLYLLQFSPAKLVT